MPNTSYEAPLGSRLNGESSALPDIPVLVVGTNWPVELLEREIVRANALLDAGSGRIPEFAIKLADSASRRWLSRWHEPYLREIDEIALRIDRPGAYFLNVSYEWGCTSSAEPTPDGRSARLIRVLDWPDRGLGRYITAVHVHHHAGSWLMLTWPGYTGILQAVAPGRFAAALNQAPMEQSVGVYPLDWFYNRCKVWKRPHLTAAHLLRQVFECAGDFAEAKRMLSEIPIALPAIFVLSGIGPEETCVIERRPHDAHVIEGPAAAANAWQTNSWPGRSRGKDNVERLVSIRTLTCTTNGDFAWLRPPVLNRRTRLAMVADASTGAVVAQGFEAEGPATAVLRWKPTADTKT